MGDIDNGNQAHYIMNYFTWIIIGSYKDVVSSFATLIPLNKVL